MKRWRNWRSHVLYRWLVLVGCLLPGILMDQMQGHSFLLPKAMAYGNNQYFNSLQYQGYRQRQDLMNMELPLSNDIAVKNQGEKFRPQIRTCVHIRKIDIKNPYHLSDSMLKGITDKWENRCLKVSDINFILKQLNDAYRKGDFVTTRAYLPEQDLSSGHLQIVIIEGHLESFDFTGGTPARLHELVAFPWVVGNVLDLNDLKQGLDNMERLPYWKPSLKIKEGHQENSSIVEVKIPKPGYIHGKVTTDNNGQSISARTMGRAHFMASDLFGIMDLWSFEYDHSLNARQTQGHNSFFSMEGSIPFGPWMVWAGWWRSDDMYHDGPRNAMYRKDVTQKDFHAGISRVVSQKGIGMTTLMMSYEYKSFIILENHIRQNYQSAHLSSLNFMVSEYTKLWDRIWYINLGSRVGLNGLQTRTWVKNQGKYVPHTGYVKLYLDMQGDQPLSQAWTWHTFIHGEWSDKNQYDNEQMQIGGPYTVRGFLRQTLAGNAGIYMRNTLSMSLPTDHMKCDGYTSLCNFVAKNTELYGVLDVGMTRAVYAYSRAMNGPKVGNISSGGIGIRKQDGGLTWDASVTHAFTTGHLAPEGWIACFQIDVSL